jgi:hypothetical protein
MPSIPRFPQTSARPRLRPQASFSKTSNKIAHSPARGGYSEPPLLSPAHATRTRHASRLVYAMNIHPQAAHVWYIGHRPFRLARVSGDQRLAASAPAPRPRLRRLTANPGPSNGVRTIIVETASRFARDLIVAETGSGVCAMPGSPSLRRTPRTRSSTTRQQRVHQTSAGRRARARQGHDR